jgi:hypothetical protein
MNQLGPRIRSNPKDFETLNSYVKPFEAKGRTHSAAFLIWFLQTIYRLDEIEAEDAVCDRKHDEGIDALVVNDPGREIVLFQAKRAEKIPSTLGDTDLKQFVGSLANFKSKRSIQHLVEVTLNDQLRKILEDKQIGEKVSSGYQVRPIFIANVAADRNATKYLPQVKSIGRPLELWDLSRIGPVLNQLERDWFIAQQVNLHTDPSRLFVIGPERNPKIVYAAIKASELIGLPGIDDLRIFAQNVRLGLGNTRVNTEILSSLHNKSEHANFITFHNGLTIVSKELKVSGGAISLNQFSVCNGCQSLLSMWEQKSRLTDQLEVLVRIVKVGDDRKLPELIAYRTNNQNAISLRDLSSNDDAQVHLKNAFESLFGTFATYTIKRGEEAPTEELGNEFVGRLLLSLYVGEPWSAHQKYRIFGDLEGRIFSYEMEAQHIRLAQLIGKSAARVIVKFKYQRLGKYGLTQFLLVFLIGQVLKSTSDGTKCLKAPLAYLATNEGPNPKETKIVQAIDSIANFIVTELNYFIKAKGGESYDYKTAFKSQADVTEIGNEILKALEKDIDTGRAKKFSLPRK